MRVWFPLGRLRGFNAALSVHVSVVIAAVLLCVSAVESPAFAAVTLGSLLALILLHEGGHAFVAHRLGYATHSIRFSLIHGRCEHDAPLTRWDQALIAWGGVAAQLLIALPLCLFDAFWPRSLGILAPVILILGYWSVIVAIFNLIPSRGLDGMTAWQILPLLRTRFKARRMAKSAVQKIRDHR